MRKQTKWTALLMSGILLLSGCSATYRTQTPAGALLITESTESEDNITSDTENSITSDTENTGTHAPSILISRDTKEWYSDDNTLLLLTVSNSLISVENDGFDALNASLSEYFGEIDAESYEYLVQVAMDDYAIRSEAEREYFWGYSCDKSAELTRCDNKAVSFRITYYDYTGGAHGMYALDGQTFDVESGELLKLTDILTDAEAFFPKAAEYICTKLYKEYRDELYPGYEEAVHTTFEDDKAVSWYLNAAGIVISYSPYELGPYSMGAPEVLLPYSEFKDYMNEKYLNASDELIASVPQNQDISALIGGKETVMVETTINEWEMLSVNVVSGTSTEKLESFGRLCDTYVIKRADGRSFLIIVCDYMSDDFVTFVYEVTGGKLKKCCEIGGMYLAKDYISTDRIGMYVRLDTLGTYMAKMDYLLDAEGRLLQTEETFTIDTASTLTVIRELPVTMDGTATTLDIGTQITVTGTNNADEVYFKVADSEQTGTICYTIDDIDSWTHLIEGVSEFEYLEGLPYAG